MDLNKTQKIKNVSLLITGVLLSFFAIFAGLKLIKQPQDIREKAAAETKIYINPVNQKITQGSEGSFSVRVDAGSNLITGMDILLNYDSDFMEVISLKEGGGANALDQTIISEVNLINSQINHVMFTLDKTKAISGSNIEALIVNYRIKSNAPLGDIVISFGANTALSAIAESINVISKKETGTITVIEPSPSPSPTSSAIGGYVEGEPNSCGGTCGSNYNCRAEFFCYNGFCRNASCPDDPDCDCDIVAHTSSPSPKLVYATAKAKTPTSTPLSTTINYYNSTTKPLYSDSDNLSELDSPTPISENLQNKTGVSKLLLLGLGLIFIVILVTIYIKSKRRNPPQPTVFHPDNLT